MTTTIIVFYASTAKEGRKRARLGTTCTWMGERELEPLEINDEAGPIARDPGKKANEALWIGSKIRVKDGKGCGREKKKEERVRIKGKVNGMRRTTRAIRRMRGLRRVKKRSLLGLLGQEILGWRVVLCLGYLFFYFNWFWRFLKLVLKQILAVFEPSQIVLSNI